MCIVILTKIFEFIGIIWLVSQVTFAVEPFRSVTGQVWAISKGVEISFARLPPTTSGIQKFEIHLIRGYFHHEQL
jgi:hypothetical protein